MSSVNVYGDTITGDDVWAGAFGLVFFGEIAAKIGKICIHVPPIEQHSIAVTMQTHTITAEMERC